MISISYEQHVLVLKMPYDRQCVEDIKSTIPMGMRQWNPDLKVWFIGLPYLGALVRLLKEYFDDADIWLDQDIPNLINIRDVVEPRHTPYAELYLLPDAPKELIHGAYRILAKLYHPDVEGGSTERMTKLNLAYEQIR